ncbi:FAD-binding oxidoreductase [Fusibacter paucivorans]|jgi:sarcosine oxidase subunit beta|uniref:FAD-binding oxidoreductase n=1 Tax=Fusibacter paucivorans TaxID=76009 RepID=A0ABS5PJG3_9FIRM|nr:FAD-binding oxidoreductase [Fusibacter paucivorans]MBS7525108.1 FAD-binding oxidoreductase [Fusibacter paucivorans]
MQQSEVLIIGGGVIGCATAYYLSKRGLSVTVIEKKQIGEGGSSRNGGGVRQSGRDPRELPIAMYAVEHLWPSLSDELEMDVEYYKKGNLRLAKTDAHLKILQGLTDRATALGLDVRMIGADEVKAINPYLSDEVIGASWCPTDGHANPMLTTLAYYRKARRQGVRFITGESAQRIVKQKGRAVAVVTDYDTYYAERILVAAGFESNDLLASVGLFVPMNRILLEALVTEAQPKMFEQMLGTAEADFYGHQSTHGSFVFGGSSGIDAYTSDFDRPVTQGMTAPSICRGIMGYFPVLADAKIVRTWAGWIDECADHVPVISNVDEVPGLTVACAFTGHGFGISPAVGQILTSLMTNETPMVNIDALRYDRFKAKI